MIARVISQGSRLSAVRLANNHGACDILDLEPFHEEHLYENLDWLADNQQEIEKKLARELHGTEKVDLYLYDVTSSYLEGTQNEFSAFGYNRDKKRGNKQIVIGLLCDYNGIPISIGNCSDTPPENWRLAGEAKLSVTQNQVVTEVQYRNLAELFRFRQGGSEQLLSIEVFPGNTRRL
uniref:Transposase n=1 Tax=Candidatus Kentrum sp. FM TaxID=2126340 RepID=A0A450TCQ7_9GAMM|nr:MAG: hypothetical protein BECKFM1743C_GA0114222_103741 [Candidatus Kentron sp. FM]